jgi:dihydropteroate synthase
MATSLLWRAGSHLIECGERTLMMGILNVTPDSFSDGGQYLDSEAAVRRGIEMATEGADIVDVGGESTRPGSDPVSPDEERERVLPVIKRLAAEVDVPISVDTRKAEVAEGAVSVGATIVNDVTAGRDPAMFGVLRDSAAGMILMHMQGDPKTMQADPRYDDVIAEVRGFLSDRLAAAESAGIDRERLCVDPGIGFGKTLHHNLTLLRNISALVELGRPILVGPSRKSFIAQLLGEDADRVAGTAGAVAWLASSGAHIVRVHDVRTMVHVVRVIDAIKTA